MSEQSTPPNVSLSPETLAKIDGSAEAHLASAHIAEYLAGKFPPLGEFTADTYLTTYEYMVRDWQGHQQYRRDAGRTSNRFPLERIDNELNTLSNGMSYAYALPFVASAIDADIESRYFGGEVCDIITRMGSSEGEMVHFSRVHLLAFLRIVGNSMDFLSDVTITQRYDTTQAPQLGELPQRIGQFHTEQLLSKVRAERILSSSRAAAGGLGDVVIDKITDLYHRWKDVMEAEQRGIPILRKFGILPVEAAVSVEALPAGPSAEMVAEATAGFEGAAINYATLTQSYRSTSGQLDKAGLRPVTTSLLRSLRDAQSPPTTTEMEDGPYAKRIVGTLQRLAIIGAKPEATIHEIISALLPKEQAAYHRVLEAHADLVAVGETAVVPPSLDGDLTWISQHWKHLEPGVTQQWPQAKGKQAAAHITAVLKELRNTRLLYEQDPRQKFYAIARHVGRAALPPEVKAASPDTQTTPVFRVAHENARQGLEDLQQQSKDIQVRQRATVLSHYLRKADASAQRTNSEKYGMYYAENAQESRDRYFIVRFQDEATKQDWFVLETLDGERATYIMPLGLIHEMAGDLRTSEEELEAVLAFNKAEARELGQLKNLRSQVMHAKDWDPESHTSEINARMQSYRTT